MDDHIIPLKMLFTVQTNTIDRIEIKSPLHEDYSLILFSLAIQICQAHKPILYIVAIV